jgi:TolB-like protein/Tfp pilus assembly protein PilF
MNELIARLKQRKLVQWALAYIAFAFALIQVLDVVAQRFGWPDQIEKLLILALAVGFVVALVLAWYHGERGAQRVSGTEIVILALLLAIGGGLLWRFERGAPSTRSPGTASSPDAAQRNPGATPSAIPIAAIPAKSIAVLPFENLSEDKGNAYFADGMQDLILTKLADIGDLKVISRTSTAKYQSHPDNLKIIAQQLGVAAILEGSVQKAGNQVLINVQLINASSDSHVWAQSYQRTLDNVFGVEGEVAQKVADALQAKLTPTETAQLATAMSGDAAANDLFMRAGYFVRQGEANHDPMAFRRAIALYQQALTKDSGFALARARLSYAESGAVWFGSGESDLRQLMADARTQAVQALAQRPRLVAAQVALGYSAYWGQGDYAAALKAFDAALALRSNDAEALGAKGFVLRRQGHLAAAIDALTQALVLDPRNISLLNGLGETRTAVMQYAQAAHLFQRAFDLDPENVQTKLDNSTNILMSSGDAARALDAAQGDQPQLLVWRAQLLTYQRKYRQALALIASIPETPAGFNYQVGPKALVQANLYHLAGDAAQARALFAQALSQSRARLSALAGPTVKQGFVWNHIAAAELGLGQPHAAFAAIAHSQSVASRSGDRFFTPGIVVSNAQLYAEAGRADLAVPLLVETFSTPRPWVYNSPALLWLDPSWDPIRRDPRFQALLKKYAKYKPASANAIAPSAFHPATPVPLTTNGAAHD